MLEPLGTVAFWLVVVIVFVECGLLMFFLPGDSLLFITGMLIATGIIAMPLWLASLILFAAAILGNIVGYWIGAKVGPPLFKPDSRFFKPVYVEKTHEFFDRYGARAIVLARFVPVVRTFITAVAGIARMDYRRFVIFSAIGGFIWAVGVTVAGYFLGSFDFVKNNIEVILALVVVVSFIPVVLEYVKHRRSRPAMGEAVDPAEG